MNRFISGSKNGITTLNVCHIKSECYGSNGAFTAEANDTDMIYKWALKYLINFFLQIATIYQLNICDVHW